MQTEARHNWAEIEAKALNGDASAQHQLGLMCESGLEVPRDYNAAFEWFRKAAEQGFPEAQLQIATKYQRICQVGPVGTLNEARIEAYRWFKLAALRGNRSAAIQRDLNALQMTREEVAEGNRRAAEFIAKAKPGPES